MKTLCSHKPLPDKPVDSPTVGDIFREFGPSFRDTHRLHPRQHKVMYDIEHCRRGEFGTHWEICDTCGHLEKGYNSCRNRHCPGCNNIARRRWVEARIDELLPVSGQSTFQRISGQVLERPDRGPWQGPVEPAR